MSYYIFIRAQDTAFDYGGNGDWSDGAPSVNVDQERGEEGRRLPWRGRYASAEGCVCNTEG